MDRSPHRRGQALVEWAVVLPLVLLLTLTIMQFSLVLIGKFMVNHAAYAAARAQLVGEDPLVAARILCSPVAGTRSAAAGTPITIPGWGDLPRSQFTQAKTSARVTQDTDASVTVEVTHQIDLWFPIVDLLFRNGTDAGGQSFLTLTEKTTLPRLWKKDSDLGLPATP